MNDARRGERQPQSQARRSPKRQVNGVLMIDKPAGMTSNGVLGVIKRLFNAELYKRRFTSERSFCLD